MSVSDIEMKKVEQSIIKEKHLHTQRAKRIEDLLLTGKATPIQIAAIAYCADAHLDKNYCDAPDIYLEGILQD